jgi:hypothetical protein
MKALVCWFGALTLFGCSDLTFSKAAVVDYERYSSLCVDASSAWETNYLINEMSNISGFSSVHGECLPLDQASLSVTTTTFAVEAGTPDDPDIEYKTTANFTLTAMHGTLLDSGDVSSQSETDEESVEDALDAVAYHYFEPYRL